MLVSFKIKNEKNIIRNYKTVYFSNDLPLDELSLKIAKLIDYFDEQIITEGKINYILFEEQLNEMYKSLNLEAVSYSRKEIIEPAIKKFLLLEMSDTFKEPEIFFISDLVGWKFIDATTINFPYYSIVFTFSKKKSF